MEKNTQLEENISSLDTLQNLRLRLLDLTNRNRLINFKHTKTRSLRTVEVLPNQLFESLLDNNEIRFGSIPEPTEEELIGAGYLAYDEEKKELVNVKQPPSSSEWAKHLGITISYEALNSYLEENCDDIDPITIVQTSLYPYELEAIVKNLVSLSESSIQETGANILYLGFGFLKWYESTSSTQEHYAPLFLVPIRINRGNLNPKTRTYEYTFQYTGEDIIPNLSLKEKLRIDFAIALPDLDENTTPEAYFNEVLLLLKENNKTRWSVHRYVSLMLLNFSKLLMYLDLNPERWPEQNNISEHPVVSKFLAGYEQIDEQDSSQNSFGFGEEYPIDEIEQIHTKYPLIDDADSSQHSALIDAIDGKDLVIEGPPGTGKSQTITNLIASVLSQGKKVLFVAEKQAALEVVRTRLDKAGLGEFCLELHSHKSQKRKLLDEIDFRLKKHGRYRNPRDIDVEISRYEEFKDSLKKHAEKINDTWLNTGKTLHEIFMAATRYREAISIYPIKFHPKGYSGNSYDLTAQRNNEEHVEIYRKVYQHVENQLDFGAKLHDHPWYGVNNKELHTLDLGRVETSLHNWQSSLLSIQTKSVELSHFLIQEATGLDVSLSDIEGLLKDLQLIPELHGDECLECIPELQGELLNIAINYLSLFEDISTQYEKIIQSVDSEALTNFSMAEAFRNATNELTKIVGSDTKLSLLYETIELMHSLEEQLVLLSEPLNNVMSELGRGSNKLITLSEDNLVELSRIVSLVASLEPSLWRHRNELFDNDELDEILPQLKEEVLELQTLHSSVEKVFDLENLPQESTIRQLGLTIAEGGLFKWFKSDWREARKQLLGLRAGINIKLADVVPRLKDLAIYSSMNKNISTNNNYIETLGEHIQGYKTNIEVIESLRNWYKSIRQTYGVGFGKQVALGTAILDLSPDIAKAIRLLAEQGIQKKIDKLLSRLTEIKSIFLPSAVLNNKTELLVGNDGLISQTLNKISHALNTLYSVINQKSLTVKDVDVLSKKLLNHHQKLEQWQEIKNNTKILQDHFDLYEENNLVNKKTLSSLKNTINVSSCIAEKIKSPALVSYIYTNPNAETFDSISDSLDDLSALLKLESESYQSFSVNVCLDQKEWFGSCSNNISCLISRNIKALENGQSLESWMNYIRQREELEKIGCASLSAAVESQEISIDQVEEAYLAGIYDLLAREILQKDPELSRFSGSTQEALQDRFREYDEKLKKLQCERIAWKIDNTNIPQGVMSAKASDRTERSLLEHEVNKKTRHIPIRQLFRRASNALVALKPCFMMGPMSVAQYLAPGEISFDLVVMDEASQIKPQDALGAVARGGQLVVVGDPKQLPPTSFFDRNVEEDEEDPTSIEESESILDATLAMFPARRLRWHYRSQHESLIAFSNYSFYDSDLVIFPSPHKEADDYGIKYFRVENGCFVNRKNSNEAYVIAEAVRKHFISHPEDSIGVVSMSADQKSQIEVAIEALAKTDDNFQELLEENLQRHESFFVKNLENVQGDERDVIFISMTYGPQAVGDKVYQRFGPINSDVGWRRLNVLFTRSKKRMHVFSSMGSDDIVISPNSKRGVRALRDFLRYCETGVLQTFDPHTGREPDSDFEISVMEALSKEGFECIPQVGVAGYFIDLAVIDPGNPGRYLMGIECDGATYHSAKSARDRDRLRQSHLERLGWEIRRIWSTDWFKNNRGTLAPIIRELHKLKTPVVDELEDVYVEETKDIEIIELNDAEASDIETYSDDSLRSQLFKFDLEVIQKEYPDTLEANKLLRPAMIEAFVEYTPINKEEFLNLVPLYLREATEVGEGKFLDDVLDIIRAFLDI